VGTGVHQRRVLRQLLAALIPVRDLADTTPRVLVQRDVELLDKLGGQPLDPVGHVLGAVL